MQRMKTAAILLTLLIFATNLPAFQATQVAELKNISFEKIEDQIVVKIEYPPTIPYDSFSLMNPNRLVLDFMGIRAVSSMPMIGINEIGIVSIRSALNRPGVARVVFNFADESPQYRIEESESGLTLTFWKGAEVAEQKEPEQITPEPVKPPVEEKEEIDEPVKEEIERARATTEGPTKKMMAFGFSAGFLTLQDDAFRDVYGEGGTFFRGEYSFYLPIKIESFDVWTGVTFFQKDGQTTLTEEELKLEITTFSLAIRYLKQFSRFTPFVGAGIDYIVYKETYPEDFIVASVGGSDLGFHVQAGVYFDALPSLSIKVHIKYNWAETMEDLVTVNLGGVEYGIGLVFRFNL
ncbi:MAG: AMIN domain-containing protein [Candidatus Aminicenantes bacterium]|nr:MAG: AMIN domain-containing protein [Candidatus Aminicenantes bacterium]